MKMYLYIYTCIPIPSDTALYLFDICIGAFFLKRNLNETAIVFLLLFLQRKKLTPDFWIEAGHDPEGFDARFISKFKGTVKSLKF